MLYHIVLTNWRLYLSTSNGLTVCASGAVGNSTEGVSISEYVLTNLGLFISWDSCLPTVSSTLLSLMSSSSSIVIVSDKF